MRLQSRILLLFLASLLAVLGLTLITVSQVTYRHTLDRAEEELLYARRIFSDKLAARQQALRESASALTKEDALRHAVFGEGADRDSMVAVLENHRARTSADLSFLVTLDGRVFADPADRRREGRPFPFPEVLSEEPAGAALLHTGQIDGVAYQLVGAPYYVPVSALQPSLWLVLARALDDGLARELRDLMGTEVAVLARDDRGRAVVVASSLAPAPRAALADSETESAGSAAGAAVVMSAPALASPTDRAVIRTLARIEYLEVTAPLAGSSAAPLAAVLLRPTSVALLDFRQLSGRFLAIALGAALFAALGALLVARGIARPIRALAEAAQRIAAGDYAAELPPGGGGEVATLTHEFGAMQEAVRQRERAIERLAFQDDLTGLPNRRQFQRELARRIAEARGGGESLRLGVALIDLDRFKDINDALGHHVGDRLLLEVAARLRAAAAARGFDIARLGGDEFAVLFPMPTVGESHAWVQELQADLAAAAEIDDLRIDIAPSIGIAVFPDNAADPSTLLKQAEAAMYAAKARRIGVAFYDGSQDRHSIERLSLLADLRAALRGEGLSLAFQPKLTLASGACHEVEVLLRWQHPRLGNVSPSEFVPLAEQTGLIRDLTTWVLEHAIRQLAAWQRGGLEVTAAVNVSALDLHDAALPARLGALLDEHRVEPRRLVLEITESSVMSEPETARRVLDELTASGVRVSIDDFGTGYSSLAQLKRLPVDELKVDKSFVLEMLHRDDLRQIVQSTIELGHNLGLTVVAEGVESAQTLEALRGMGCDFAQGFFVSEPRTAVELERWLREPARTAARALARRRST